MMNKRRLTILLAFLLLFSHPARLIAQKPLIDFFSYSPDKEVIISAHRGGKGYKGYPENCLETMKFIKSKIPNALFEIDIAQSKDGILVLMHDNTLERTTTGIDHINKYTFKELEKLYLQDDFGTKTNFRIPRLKDVLKWAKKSNAYLSIDIKRSVDKEQVLEFIEKQKAMHQCVFITYTLEDAKKLYQLNQEIFLSVTIRNIEEYKRFKEIGIPSDQVMAFTGTKLSPPILYKKLHAEGIMCILGTLGNLDKKAAAKGDHLYKEWRKLGIDIFATDRPLEVYSQLK